jgi:sodium/potassium/calcium exchanger 6
VADIAENAKDIKTNLPQTFGFIFGLSDAIIGLTIFAVGNSLADFVANMSVAVSNITS